jgi:hypothetical protein
VLVVAALRILWRRADPGRRATLLALMMVAAVFLVLSWGPRLRIFEWETPIPLPYAALAHLPLFDAALPARLALVVTCVVAVVLALITEWLLAEPIGTEPMRAAMAAGVAVSLLPLLPTPLLTRHRAPEPAFISRGLWRDYVPEGGGLSAIPVAVNTADDGQRWQAYVLARGQVPFRMPGGYFLGPGGRDGQGRVGAPWRPTDWLLFRAATYGYVGRITDADREQARRDFAYWGVDAVFLPDEITGPDGPLFRAAAQTAATELLGPGQRVGDVQVWRIRPGVDPVTPGR